MKPTKFSTLLTALIAGVFIITFSSCSKDTTPTVPSLTTRDASDVTDTSAKIGGVVTEDGGAAVIERGVCYNTSPNPSISDNPVQLGSGTGTFDYTLTGLYQGSEYFYKAYAINSSGVGYGEQKMLGIPLGPCPGIPTITYDGQVYNTVQIGNQCWLKENLNVGMMISGSEDMTNNGILEKYCYENDVANCAIYGGSYQWAEMVQYLNGASNYSSWSPVPTGNVIGICPDGWHVPSDAEWIILADYLGGSDVAGRKMKSTTGWYNNWNGSNSSGFTGLPSGGRYKNGNFSWLTINGGYWSSTESTDATHHAWLSSLFYYSSNMGWGRASKELGKSCRCVQD